MEGGRGVGRGMPEFGESDCDNDKGREWRYIRRKIFVLSSADA